MAKKYTYITDTKAVEAAIRKAEGRARVRRITPETIVATCEKVQSYLGIAKSHLVGVKIYADVHAHSFANAYMGIPESTKFEAVYTHGGWALTGVYRGSCGTGVSRAVKIYLTDEARNAVVARCEYMSWY